MPLLIPVSICEYNRKDSGKNAGCFRTFERKNNNNHKKLVFSSFRTSNERIGLGYRCSLIQSPVHAWVAVLPIARHHFIVAKNPLRKETAMMAVME